MLTLNTPVSDLTRVGKTTASRLKRLGIETAEDLLFYYPFRYDDYSRVVPIAKLAPEQPVTIKARIEIIENKRSKIKRKILTEAMVADEAGDRIKAVWFNQPFLTKTLRPGDWVYLAGKADYDGWNSQLVSPSYEKIEPWKKETTHTARLVPIYPTTANLTEKQIRFLAKVVMPLASQVKDFLPEEIKRELKLIDLNKALLYIHFPENSSQLNQARERLAFDELFLIQLKAQRARAELKQSQAPKIEFREKETKSFVESLPFKLTDAQRKTAWEIIKDLGKETPMNRLLEGDVGSGKTVVAVIAGLNVILSGYQVILMAPTEILAKQHFENIKKLFKNKPKVQSSNYSKSSSNLQKNKKIDIGILTRTEKEVKISKDGIITSDFIVGTHALIQENVKFNKVGLVIIDEQHRFGVEQRKKLKEQTFDVKLGKELMRNCENNAKLRKCENDDTAKIRKMPKQFNNETMKQCNDSESPDIDIPTEESALNQSRLPHFLSMTATPIPRSLALTLYGDLDLSVIDEMPANRKKIITKIVDSSNRDKAYDFIHQQIKQCRQVFVVCPLIEESEKLEVKSAETEYEKIDKQIFPHLRVGLIHGRLKTKEKEQVRQDFWKGKLDILVATAVVEVGIDVPNATVMMIEGADRFGLAQLHQFRGRVGRSEYQSYCFLFTESEALKTKQRLEALITAKNGFELAERDLEIRGPGEVYGKSQSGFFNGLKIAKLTDYDLIKKAREQAEKTVALNFELGRWPLLKQKAEGFEREVHFE